MMGKIDFDIVLEPRWKNGLRLMAVGLAEVVPGRRDYWWDIDKGDSWSDGWLPERFDRWLDTISDPYKAMAKTMANEVTRLGGQLRSKTELLLEMAEKNSRIDSILLREMHNQAERRLLAESVRDIAGHLVDVSGSPREPGAWRVFASIEAGELVGKILDLDENGEDPE